MKETQHIEWKESWRDEYLRWICGFANAEGGVLVIRRNDRGEVVGVKNASRLLQEIPNKVRDILGIMVDVNLIEEAGKETLEIVVEPYPSPGCKGEYRYRSGSIKQELKSAAFNRFLLRKQGRHWDAVPVPCVTLADLADRSLSYFRKRAEHSGRLSSTILPETNADLIDKLRQSRVTARVATRVAARVKIARSAGAYSACLLWFNIQIGACRCLRAKRGLRSSESAYAQAGGRPVGGLHDSQQTPKPAAKVSTYRRRLRAAGGLATRKNVMSTID
jgi:hypothetical protein